MNGTRTVKYKILFDVVKDELSAGIKTVKTLALGIAGLAGAISNLTELTDKYNTAQQVLNHTFGSGSKEINNYVNHLSEMAGVNKATVAQSISLFGQLGSSLGMNTELAGEFAEKLTDLATRISILYNADFTRASKAVLGAMKGEVRTLATITGISVKSQAQQRMLDNLGITAKVGELNATNQALLKYILVASQVMESNEKMAEYAESVAFQKKVLTNQVKNLAQAFGNLLYPVMKAILPVINGVLMALANLVNFFAGLFGYSEPDSTGIKQKTEDIDALGTAIEKSGEKAKKGLRGFDKLNNITTPTSDTSGINAGANAKLLEQMRALDDQMLNIRMRATEISESIMKWLGFEKNIDTGKWEFVKTTFGTILGIFAGAGGLLFVAGSFLKTIKNIKNAFKGLSGLGKIGEAIGDVSQVGEASSRFKLPSFKTVLKGIGELSLIIGALTGLVVAMGALTKIEGFTDLTSNGIDLLVKLFSGIAKIMIPLALVSAGITLLGMAGFTTVASGLGGFAIVLAGTTAVVSVLGLITKISGFNEVLSSGIDMVIKLFKGLGEIMIPLAVLSGLMVGLGLATPATIALGLAGLAIVIDGTAIVMASLGALYKIPYFEELVNGGIEALVGIFKGLGRALGALIGGFAGGISEGLPIIGTNLSKFAENAKSFFEITENFNSDNALGVKYLAEALIVLTANNLLNGIVNFFTLGFVGQKTSLEAFGIQLEKFAPHFKKFAKNIEGIDSKTVKESADSAKSLSEVAKNLPNSGGWKDIITGTNDIDKWGSKLPAFGKYLKEYSLSVKGLDSEVIENSVKSAKSVSELAKNLPNEGGIASWFAGDNAIDKFGQKLASFGKSFKEYATEISNISVDKINTTTEAIKGIVDTAIKIKNNGVKDTLKDFANSLKGSVNPFNNFFSNTNGNTIGKDFGKGIASGIVSALKNYNYPSIKLTEPSIFGTSNTVKSFGISVKGNGGFVDSGELYIARENGISEMIGRIGSHTAVANNDQIVEAVASGVARANMATQKNTKIEIVAEGDSSGLLDFITFKQKEQNRQYGF